MGIDKYHDKYHLVYKVMMTEMLMLLLNRKMTKLKFKINMYAQPFSLELRRAYIIL